MNKPYACSRCWSGIHPSHSSPSALLDATTTSPIETLPRAASPHARRWCWSGTPRPPPHPLPNSAAWLTGCGARMGPPLQGAWCTPSGPTSTPPAPTASWDRIGCTCKEPSTCGSGSRARACASAQAASVRCAGSFCRAGRQLLSGAQAAYVKFAGSFCQVPVQLVSGAQAASVRCPGSLCQVLTQLLSGVQAALSSVKQLLSGAHASSVRCMAAGESHLSIFLFGTYRDLHVHVSRFDMQILSQNTVSEQAIS